MNTFLSCVVLYLSAVGVFTLGYYLGRNAYRKEVPFLICFWELMTKDEL